MQMNLYAVGGAGCNIGRSFAEFIGETTPGFAGITPFFIDASNSNLTGFKIPAEQIYLVEGLDGSGKLRPSNAGIFTEAAKEILHQFKPADINVIVTSASGGSGSVIGPILTSELLGRGQLVINMVIGSTGSKIETTNTLATLKSYEGISQRRKAPSLVFYRENSDSMSRGQVDDEIFSAIVLLAAIFSGQNRELDSEDLKNWVNYQNVTSFDPHLTLLDFFYGKVELPKGQALTSAVTLVEEGGDYSLNRPCEYHTHGFAQKAAISKLSKSLPVHACGVAGYFNPVIERLSEKVGSFDEARSLYVDKPILGKGEAADDNGMMY